MGFSTWDSSGTSNLLIAGAQDLSDRVLPAGRLREPLTAAASADALLVDGSSPAGIDRVQESARRRHGVPSSSARSAGHAGSHSGRAGVGRLPATSILAVAGIARPDRFFADLEAAHLRAQGEARVPRSSSVHRRRHRRASPATARDAGATLVLTTEKDAVRLAARRLGDLRIRGGPADRRHRALVRRLAPVERDSSRHSAPGTEHPAPGTQHPAPGRRHP